MNTFLPTRTVDCRLVVVDMEDREHRDPGLLLSGRVITVAVSRRIRLAEVRCGISEVSP